MADEKKPEAKKLKNFFKGDLKEIGKFAWGKLVGDSDSFLRKSIVDIGIEILKMSVYGTNSPQIKAGSTPYNLTGTTNYNKPNTQTVTGVALPINKKSTRYGDVIAHSQDEARRILDEVTDTFKNYGVVTVSDLYSSAKLSHDYNDLGCGWDALEGIMIEQLYEGFLIKMPTVKKLSK